jgi:hypothetical protein
VVEGSLWVYGNRTDLADFYRGDLTLRQVWVRLRALAEDAPLWVVLEAEQEKAKQRKQADDIDAALAPFKRKG